MKRAKSKISVQKEVMSQIKSGKVRMRPQIYFSLISVVLVLVTVLSGLVMAYVFSMLIYLGRINSASTPAYGARANLAEAWANFPWWAVLLAGLLAGLSIWLIRKYGQAYRWRKAVVIAIFLLASLLVGIGMSFFGLGQGGGHHQRWIDQKQRSGYGRWR